MLKKRGYKRGVKEEGVKTEGLKEVVITTSHTVCHLLHVANSEYRRKARDEIIDKTLDKYTAAMASVKL